MKSVYLPLAGFTNPTLLNSFFRMQAASTNRIPEAEFAYSRDGSSSLVIQHSDELSFHPISLIRSYLLVLCTTRTVLRDEVPVVLNAEPRALRYSHAAILIDGVKPILVIILEYR